MSVKLELDLQTLLLQRLHSSPAAIEQFCKRWKITEFSLFGSVLREDFAPSSDVDVHDPEPCFASAKAKKKFLGSCLQIQSQRLSYKWGFQTSAEGLSMEGTEDKC